MSLLNLGAILIASAKACAGSSDGLTFSFSNFEISFKASRASSSVAEVYLALLESFKRQCNGETPG